MISHSSYSLMIAFSLNCSYYRRDVMKDLWVEDPLENPLWYHFVRAMRAGKRKRNNANMEVKGIVKHPSIISITERFPRQSPPCAVANCPSNIIMHLQYFQRLNSTPKPPQRTRTLFRAGFSSRSANQCNR